MIEKEITLSHKQELFFRVLDDPTIVDILFGGGAGSSKSISVSLWMLIQMRNYPGIRIGLGRKEITRLKQTTVVTLLREAHSLLGIKPDEFIYQEQKGLITYKNGSSIQLVDMARQPSDPDCDRFGSLNLTHVVLEEVGEITKKERDVLISRKNRFLNKEYNLVGKSISTCNPSQNYIKAEYYKPYKELGSGEWQKWEHGKVEIDGKMQTAYRAFIRSLATDNPFLPRNYIEVLRKLPEAERKRLLEGDWDYESTANMLFPSELIDRSYTGTIEQGTRFMGVDVADAGDDRTIISVIAGNTLVEQFEFDVDKSKAIGDQIAMEIIKVAQQNNILPTNIAVDVIGVGASTRDFLRSKGWHIKEFIAGSAVLLPPTQPITFRNLRGQTIYGLSQALDKSEFKIYSGLKTLDKVREQLMAHTYETQEKMILVKQKKLIKEELGESPDHAESAYIGYWVSQGDKDPRKQSSRIVF